MGIERIDLSGTWQVTGAGLQAPITIPGDVHSALLAAGQIEDPYWGTNELDLQHLHGEDFTLSRSIDVTQVMLDAPHLYLHFDSIDTIAAIFVNGGSAGAPAHMFARYNYNRILL